MDLIAGYRSDGAPEDSGPSSSGRHDDDSDFQMDETLGNVSAAPEVDTTGLTLVDDQVVPRSTVFQYPGPANPADRGRTPIGLQNHRAGMVEDAHLASFVFDEQHNTFHSYGYSMDPSGEGMVGSSDAWTAKKGETVYSIQGSQLKKRRQTTAEKRAERTAKSKRLEEGPAQGEKWTLEARQPWAEKEAQVVALTEEQEAFMETVREEKAASSSKQGPEEREAKSFFHGKEEHDYSGRSWLAPPRDKKKENDYCYLPKRWIHTWSGHTKGVNAIRFFPISGHLLLSAGLDGRVKIWDVFNTQKCMRTYLGHSKGVRDICFSNDGRRFVSTGYDCNIRCWDTETGAVLRTLNNKRVFYVVKLHPDDAKQNVLMGGCADKKVYQWDLDTGDLIQEYDYHLDAVNTITFVDEGRRFVTSSDDKTLRVWEFGIPVQIKYIADPSMHSIPSIALHPTGNYFSGQSQDNQVVTYSTKERFRLNRKKTFKGHMSAGYACQVNFSPDGRFVMSGDSDGRCFFWEWHNPRRVVRTIKAHEEGVCIGCEWHPMETSKVATCGWDGLIKYWD